MEEDPLNVPHYKFLKELLTCFAFCEEGYNRGNALIDKECRTMLATVVRQTAQARGTNVNQQGSWDRIVALINITIQDLYISIRHATAHLAIPEYYVVHETMPPECVFRAKRYRTTRVAYYMLRQKLTQVLQLLDRWVDQVKQNPAYSMSEVAKWCDPVTLHVEQVPTAPAHDMSEQPRQDAEKQEWPYSGNSEYKQSKTVSLFNVAATSLEFLTLLRYYGYNVRYLELEQVVRQLFERGVVLNDWLVANAEWKALINRAAAERNIGTAYETITQQCLEMRQGPRLPLDVLAQLVALQQRPL